MGTTEPLQPLLVDLHQVRQLVQLSARTIWRRVASGAFPAPIEVGGARRWVYTEIQDWVAKQVTQQRQPA